MNISEYIALCKHNSYELEKFHPTPESHNRFLDLSAQEFGFKHYTAMVNLQKILPSDVEVSHEAIENAGGNYCEFLTDGIFYNVDSVQNYIESSLNLIAYYIEPIESFLDNKDYDDQHKCFKVLSVAGDMTLNSKRLPDYARLIAIKAIKQILKDSRLKDNWEEASVDWAEGNDHFVKPHIELLDNLKGQLSLQH